MTRSIETSPKTIPELDPEFAPAVLWERAFDQAVAEEGNGKRLAITTERVNGAVSRTDIEIFDSSDSDLHALNMRRAERALKLLLWMKGGGEITIAGDADIAAGLRGLYSPDGPRAFDHEFIGERIHGAPMRITAARLDDAPEERFVETPLGGHFEGCRIGFDLGGSDRKCAAVIDGEPVFSDEVEWDPYFQTDPQYHLDGIEDTLKRAAAHLPRVDAIGGSAAGVYVDNQVRVASLFRGVPDDVFNAKVVDMFERLKEKWGVPLVVVNDGEVTALAGAAEMGDAAVLGISMGTSQAAGYVTPDGKITDWLNELAFVPVDYRRDAPADEWSGDLGCGVQYFSQQAVARLAPSAGIEFGKEVPLPDRLVEIQKLMGKGDERAAGIYRTIGAYFAYAIARYADFYDFRNLLILGRVTSGNGGEAILSTAEKALAKEFPELAEKVTFRTPDEKAKRHGQAVAAAGLPAIENK
jgi:predicted NBD/HSP70 family sugar kinase